MKYIKLQNILNINKKYRDFLNFVTKHPFRVFLRIRAYERGVSNDLI